MRLRWLFYRNKNLQLGVGGDCSFFPSMLFVNRESPMRGSRGGWAGGPDPPPPLKNHKNIKFNSNTGLDPLKIAKLPSQHTMLSHHRHASETPFNNVSLAGR